MAKRLHFQIARRDSVISTYASQLSYRLFVHANPRCSANTKHLMTNTDFHLQWIKNDYQDQQSKTKIVCTPSLQ